MAADPEGQAMKVKVSDTLEGDRLVDDWMLFSTSRKHVWRRVNDPIPGWLIVYESLTEAIRLWRLTPRAKR
ncbi:MAG TPA: hypothetical protein VGK56_01270 [Anaerolineales bacterium]